MRWGIFSARQLKHVVDWPWVELACGRSPEAHDRKDALVKAITHPKSKRLGVGRIEHTSQVERVVWQLVLLT